MARDYRGEYQRRIERGTTLGRSRAQARGHPRLWEQAASKRPIVPAYEPTLEEGLKDVRRGAPIGDAARAHHVSPERLRAYLQQTGVAEKRNGRWTITNDLRPRWVPIYSRGRELLITVRGFEEASLVGSYFSAGVGRLLATNNPIYLEPFRGKGVHDIRGRLHTFETDPNEVYRLASAGPTPFEQVYRILV